MGQLVVLPVHVQGNVVIPGRVQQQDLAGLGIYHRQNVHVAVAGGVDVALAAVDAVAVNHEGLGDLGPANGNFHLAGDCMGVNDPGLFLKIGVFIHIRQLCHCTAGEQNGVNLRAVQGVNQCGGIGTCADGKIAQLLLEMLKQIVGILCVETLYVAVSIAKGIPQILSGIVHPHQNGDLPVFHQLFTEDLIQLVDSVPHVGGKPEHTGRQDHRQHAAQQLTQLIAAQRDLHHNVDDIDRDQTDHDEEQVALSQQAGGRQLEIEHQAGNRQNQHGYGAKMIHGRAFEAMSAVVRRM